MLRRLLCLLVVIGCSAPGVVKKRDVREAPDADVATRCTEESPPPLPPPPLQVPSQPEPYKFEWELVREAWKKAPNKLPCDACLVGMGPAPPGWCCLPGGKAQRAAKVGNTWRVGSTHTRLEIDIGTEALVTKDWYAALIDEDGHVIGDWSKLEHVLPWRSRVVVPVNESYVHPWSARVAVVEELPE